MNLNKGILNLPVKLKRLSVFIVFSFLILANIFAGGNKEDTTPKPNPIKNVIFLIPDGMSLDCVTLARWVKGGAPLAMDEIACGLVMTHNADTPIADSAPAGSAYATGYKTNSPYISVLPSKSGLYGSQPVTEPFKPVATILEAAKLSGLSVGLVTTCEIAHATPAAFSAHTSNRRNYDDIIEQQVYNGLNVVFSGGYKFLKAENRKDKEDLVAELTKLGYVYLNKRADFDKLTSKSSNYIWGLFAEVDLAYEIDREPIQEPSLAEMTKKAIEILSQDKDGFFLMVEGSKIDWAAHANEPIALVYDILAFDEAVKVALDFAKNRKDTVVIVASDHGNSGLTIGDRTISKGYEYEPLDTFTKIIKSAKKSGYVFSKLVKEDKSNVKEVLTTIYGITDISEEEMKMIKNTKLDPNTGMDIIGKLVAKRSKLGFTTNGHTGEDVVLYVYTPKHTERLTGVVQNTDLALYIAKLLNLDLKATDNALFVNANILFKDLNAKVIIDKANPDNPLLKVVLKNNTEIVFPENKNYCLVNGQLKKLDGVNVFIEETNNWYLSKKVLEYIK